MILVLFACIFMYIFIAGSMTDYIDYDFYARLIVGKTFFQTGDILKYDFLSYAPTHFWYDHEWGASVIFYFILDHFGDMGLLFLKTTLLFLTFVFLILIIRLRRKFLAPNTVFPIFNFLFFYVFLVAMRSHIYSLRCHHFTFFFFAIWLYVLEKARLEKNYKSLWILPPLMLIWSNIHGGCFMAIGVTGIYLTGEFLKKRSFMPYLYTIIFSFLFMFINPYGINYVIFLLKATTMNRPYISEWKSPFSSAFTHNKAIIYKMILFFTFGTIIYKFTKVFKSLSENSKLERIKKIYSDIDVTKALLILILGLLSVKSSRFIPYFLFIVISFCYDDFYAIFNKRLPDKINTAKEIIIFVIIYAIFFLNILFNEYKNENYHNIFPLSEIEFLKMNNIKGNILVPFEIGSYAAYKLFPQNYIFMDGRYEEAYPPEINDDYLRHLALGLGKWKEELEHYRHDIILIYTKYDIFYAKLQEDPDYIETMGSKNFGIFLRKDVWEKAKKPFIIPPSEPEYYREKLWETSIDWKK